MRLEKEQSDKEYWHKYINYYERYLPEELENLLEIGVFKGESIKFWRQKYPSASISGMDIIAQDINWPVDNNINYYTIDQGDKIKYKELLLTLNKKFDLVIEDGSHDPLHQKISLIETIGFIKKGGIYILEDIQTSHPNHPYYKTRAKKFSTNIFHKLTADRKILMPLQAILLLEFLIANNIQIQTIRDTINFNKSLFSYDELVYLRNKLKKIKIYKRTVLPNFCYACKTNNFNFINLKCSCGVDLYSETDSMSALLFF